MSVASHLCSRFVSSSFCTVCPKVSQARHKIITKIGSRSSCYCGLLIVFIVTFLDVVRHFLFDTTCRMKLPELQKLTPPRCRVGNYSAAKIFRSPMATRWPFFIIIYFFYFLLTSAHVLHFLSFLFLFHDVYQSKCCVVSRRDCCLFAVLPNKMRVRECIWRYHSYTFLHFTYYVFYFITCCVFPGIS